MGAWIAHLPRATQWSRARARHCRAVGRSTETRVCCVTLQWLRSRGCCKEAVLVFEEPCLKLIDQVGCLHTILSEKIFVKCNVTKRVFAFCHHLPVTVCSDGLYTCCDMARAPRSGFGVGGLSLPALWSSHGLSDGASFELFPLQQATAGRGAENI